MLILDLESHLATRVDAATTLKFHTIGTSNPATAAILTHTDEHGNAATLSHSNPASPFIEHKEVAEGDGERVRTARRTAARRTFLYPPLDEHDPLLSLDQLRYNHFYRASSASSSSAATGSGGRDNEKRSRTPPQEQLAAELSESEKPAASRSVTVKRVLPRQLPLGISTATTTARTLKRKQPPALYVSPTIPLSAVSPSTARVVSEHLI